jgi:drug/metabolite transporter (DMT)-like permease
MAPDYFVGVSAALGSAASWAIGAILFKQLGETLSALAMTLVKGAASVVLLALALLAVKTGIIPGLNLELIDNKDLALLAFSGILGIAVGDSLFFAALQSLGPHLLVVLVLLGQVLTVALAVVFLGERPEFHAWLGIFLTVAGVGMVLFAKLDGDKQKSQMRGILLGLLSALCMAASTIIAKVGLKADPYALQGTFIRMLAGTVAMFIFGLTTQNLGKWVLPFNNWKLAGRFLLATCIVTFGGFWLSMVAIQKIYVSIASTLTSLEPLFVLFLSAILLKDKITLPALGGTLTAVMGVVLMAVPSEHLKRLVDCFLQ